MSPRTSAWDGVAVKPWARIAPTADCRPTNDAAGPSATSQPLANPHTAATIVAAIADCPPSDPRTIETAMPAAAQSITPARLRYAPWKDPKPTDTAPTAPKTPTKGHPLATPSASGIATPQVQRRAGSGSNCDQSVRSVVARICPVCRRAAGSGEREGVRIVQSFSDKNAVLTAAL